MKNNVREKLIEEYNSLLNKNKSTSIKYYFLLNNVNVNLYFDAYDSNSPLLSMILSSEKKYYYTSLNVNNDNIRVEYLEKIPMIILEKILDKDNTLTAFFRRINEHIMNNNGNVINYNKDVYFMNTIKFANKSRKDLPFFHHLRKTPMSDSSLELLYQTMGITRDILRKIQSSGYTIVRTGDISKRAVLTTALKRELGV
ncbi:hypothetical protein E4T80_07875 [Muribacter muris]|uniref:Uncharacterized protein n=1 Tax=Muribacter muris TaxID=67855 RepID=A0A4Y9JVX0_9PAST|nr:hypothetical protein [Muribacter muris]MBF0785376.1 hypothetical protein [Muribacter muris]MBF0826031.1 hypothetical protein [Muribacter muris]TFV09638.1 hypothetical protein E4T80_07875 [Muribacter muris]